MRTIIMTQVSRRPLRKEIEGRMVEIFLDTVARVQTRKQVKRLLDDWLSPPEQIMLAKRLSIAVLLYKQYDQRTIARLLHVGVETVNRVSRVLRSGNGGYEMIVSEILKEEKLVAFFDKLDDILAEIFKPHRDWSSWRKARWESKMERRKPY